MEYKNQRLQESIIRRGKPVEGKRIAFPTVNRELAFLRYLLNLAYDDGLIDNAPRMKLESEKSRKRSRIASDEEYQAMLGIMPRPAQRVLIGLYESAMRVNELLRLPRVRARSRHGLVFRALEASDRADRRSHALQRARLLVPVELRYR